jgi:hypothetical protein
VGDPVAKSCLVLRLPADPVKALLLTLQLPEAPWCGLGCLSLIVLSPFRPGYLLRVMACLTLPCTVYVLDARLPAETLCNAVLMCRKSAGAGIGLRTAVLSALSAHERHALYESLLTVTVHSQAKRRAVSVKTVYSQRARALKKLGVSDLSGLVGCFGGMLRPCIRLIGKRLTVPRQGEKNA